MRTFAPLLAAACLLAVAGCGPREPAPANVEFARVFERASRRSGAPDQSRLALEELRGKEPGNGFTSYLIAATYADKHDWASVGRELDAGNSAPYCVHYVQSMGLDARTPGYRRLRDLAEAATQAAPALGADQGAALLRGVRTMAGKVARGKPGGFVPVLVCIALRNHADKGLVATFRRAGRAPEVTKAREAEAADRRWAEQARAVIRSTMDTLTPGALAQKHGLTQAELSAYAAGQALAGDVKRKVDAMTEELRSTEQAATERALAGLPE